MTKEESIPTTRRALLASTAAATATLSGCSGTSSTPTERTQSSTPADSPTASPTATATDTPRGTPEAVQTTFEEARTTLNEAFVELNTINPWRKDGYEYYMDRNRFFRFDGDLVRRKAERVGNAIDEIQPEIPEGTKAELVAASLASTALLARAASKQFEAIGRATLKWSVATGQFSDGNYAGVSETMNEGLDAMHEFKEPAVEVANAIKSYEAIGFAPSLPAFEATQWPEEQDDLGRVWARASEAFRGYRTTAIARNNFSKAEEELSARNYQAAIDLYTEAAAEFATGGDHLEEALEQGLVYYDYRANELACIAPNDQRAMGIYADAARAFADGNRERGEQLRSDAVSTRREGRTDCEGTDT